MSAAGPPLSVVLAPLDQGVANVGGRPGAAQGPARLLTGLTERGILPSDTQVREPEVANTPEALEEDLDRLSQIVAEVLEAGRFPLVLGGDHGTTFATVRGVVQATGSARVAYLDVHFDMRPFQPTHTSGSSFRRLIEQRLVAPEQVVPLGIQAPGTPEARSRSGYDALEAWADERGVPWRTLAEVRRRGVARSVDQALAGPGTPVFSLDTDALDRRVAPGVSAPGEGRFTLEEACQAARAAAGRARVMDVVEYAPPLDEEERTLESLIEVLRAFLSARAVGAGTAP